MPKTNGALSDYKIVSSYNAADLSSSIAKKLSKEHGTVELTEFPDGEFKIRFDEDYRNSRVLLVHRLYPEASRSVVALLFMLHKLAENGNSIDIFIPYFAFGRQDKEFIGGEVVSAAALLQLLRKYGVKRVFTFDMHSRSATNVSGLEVIDMPTAALLAKYVNSAVKMKSKIVVAPDRGAEGRAAEAANELGCDHISLEKRRDRYTGEVYTSEPAENFSGKDALIIDDIISTGGTVANASLMLKKKGANAVYVACTHYLYLADTETKLFSSGTDKIFATDTINGKFSKVGIADEFASFYAKSL
ncbi:MAG: ribose-phosphate diphosphokinase [Candidatus Micrarchaeaceae archaeon]